MPRYQLRALLTLLATFPVAAQGQDPGAGRGAVVGFVTAKEDGRPLPYADVAIERYSVAAFTTDKGRFSIGGIPAGVVQIRVRRLGFSPHIETVTIAADRTDTIRVALSALSIQLARVRVADAVCPNRDPTTVDTAVVAILQQVRMNAERSRLLAHEYPFQSAVERTVADERGSGRNPDRTIVRVDTILLPGEHEWRYAPGKIIVPNTDDNLRGVRDKMVVPQLVDFADEAFVAAHCFRFAGLEVVDGQRMIRVDFEPTRAVRDPDVRGSLYLDTLTYGIHRSTLLLERPAPRPSRDTWEVRVETHFNEIVPSLSVIDRISSRTTGKNTRNWASIEVHRLLEFRFIDRRPGEP